MKIKIGSITLTAEYKETNGTYIIVQKEGEETAKIDSGELKAAIEALEKACWRP